MSLREVNLELKFSKGEQLGKKRIRRRALGALKITEDQLQSQCEEYLNIIGLPFIRFPSTLYRKIFGPYNTLSAQVRGWLSTYMKGVPDLTILHPWGRYLCVELKTQRGKLSQGQKGFAKRVPVTVCRSFEGFRDLVDRWRVAETSPPPHH